MLQLDPYVDNMKDVHGRIRKVKVVTESRLPIAGFSKCESIAAGTDASSRRYCTRLIEPLTTWQIGFNNPLSSSCPGAATSLRQGFGFTAGASV